VDAEARVLPDERSGGTRMVEVDVREQQVPQVRELEPAVGQSGLQRSDGGGRPAVEERNAVVGLHEVHADDTLVQVEEVDRLERGHTL